MAAPRPAKASGMRVCEPDGALHALSAPCRCLHLGCVLLSVDSDAVPGSNVVTYGDSYTLANAGADTYARHANPNTDKRTYSYSDRHSDRYAKADSNPYMDAVLH